ncbi:MAG: acyltransferase family protein [Deltaproteobacteria bacterium]|nr:MAG: acyltransferase family protein [Deltaproteobacteria bacterium]
MPLLPDPHELPPNFEPAGDEVLAAMRPLVEAIQRYHRHEVFGIENVPKEGGVLFAVNHSFATYDGVLLAKELIDHGRVPSALGDDLIFRTPRLRRWARSVGIVPASHTHGEELLQRGRLVLVAPGGMREALRPSEERYHVRWDNRKGFVKLALRAQVPIQLGACPDADRLYHIYENTLTKLAYKRFHVPVPLLRGWGPTLIPRPVHLVHVISELLHPEPLDEERFDEQVDDWHSTIVTRMNELMDEGRRAL